MEGTSLRAGWLAVTLNKRKPLSIVRNRPSNYRSRKFPHRFNEELDTISQRSDNKRRAISRGAAPLYKIHNNSHFDTIKIEDEKNNLK